MATYSGANSTFLSDAFQSVNNALATFVTSFSSGIANEISPIVYLFLVLSFIILGIMAVRGLLDSPFLDVAMKMMKASIIVSIALNAATFQQYIVDVLLTLPDELVTSVVQNSVSGSTMATGQGAAQAIEQLYDLGTYNAGQYFENGSISVTGGMDLMPYLLGFLVLVGTLMCVIVGTLWLFVAKIVLALMIGVAPLFIVMLIWQPTQQYFFSWLNTVFNTVISAIFVVAVFSIFSAIFKANLEALVIAPENENFMDAATFIFLGMVCMGVLLQIPTYVSQLTGASAGAVGTAISRMTQAAGGAVSGTAGAVATGGRSAIAAKSATGAYQAARNGGAGRFGAARTARNDFHKSMDDMKRGYPQHYKK